MSRVVGWGSADDALGDGIRDLSVVEVPNISAHTFPVGSILRVTVPDVGHVTVPSCLECATSQASVVCIVWLKVIKISILVFTQEYSKAVTPDTDRKTPF